MGQALYRKYRSKSLDEIVGQQHITKTLKNALKSGKISHAYLLTGPRGVGKTSVARILAFAINDIPYSEDPQLDIIEIDAASNRRIDEVRDLRDKVNILPTKTKYKVYIIDEVHMLTREAFNALLKTLEEPPAHVVFVLATTEAHKLPETIVSRTQHFVFKPIEEPVLKDHLAEIAKKENIDVDDEALELLAARGKGSFRDSIGLLDQIRNSATSVQADTVREVLGLVPSSQIDEMLAEINTGTAASLIHHLQELRTSGVAPAQIAEQLAQRLRHQIIEGTHSNVDLLKKLLEVQASPYAASLLEVVLLEELLSSKSTPSLQPAAPKQRTAQVKESVDLTNATPEEVQQPPIKQQQNEPSKIPNDPTAEKKSTKTGEGFNISDWPAVLATIKKKHNTLYGILRMAEPSFESPRLTLTFRFAFHQKQLSDASKRTIITGIIQDLFGETVEVDCALSKKTVQKKPQEPKPKNELLDTVSNIFGGAEVLES